MDIPLKMKGVISDISMQKPADQEVAHIPQIHMALALPWDPNSKILQMPSSSLTGKQRPYRNADSLPTE
jgi:hypothetical protein